MQSVMPLKRGSDRHACPGRARMNAGVSARPIAKLRYKTGAGSAYHDPIALRTTAFGAGTRDYRMNTADSDQVLIVDDDKDIRNLLADYLGQHGIRCLTAGDGRAMKKALAEHAVDLIILDLMLPGEDGLTLCRNLRAGGGPQAGLPVLMLTARGDDLDRVLGLEMGADDYLPKPFIPRELLARVRAILRRTRALPPNLATAPGEARYLAFADWRLDRVQRDLIAADGTRVALSSGEFRLLAILLDHAGSVLSRDQLMQLTRGRDADPFDRAIDLQVSRLRQRLNDSARHSDGTPQLIKTVRNEGYVLAATVTPIGDNGTEPT